jgi:hypothetical protein
MCDNYNTGSIPQGSCSDMNNDGYCD